MNHGSQFKITFSSADATTAAALTISDANSVARTLASNERFIIDHIVLNRAAASTLVRIFDDLNGDGLVGATELMLSATSPTGTPLFASFDQEGLPGGLGRMPKVIASAIGLVEVTGTGHIVTS